MVYETLLSVYNPYRGRVYMCVAGSGGGTRYARLPPVIEIIPHSGYLSPPSNTTSTQIIVIQKSQLLSCCLTDND